MTRSSSISLSYTASDNSGGSGLAEVDLYAKGPGQPGYSKAASDTSGASSGSFSYTASTGEGNYSFYTVATDRAGFVESAPEPHQGLARKRHSPCDETRFLEHSPLHVAFGARPPQIPHR